MALVVVAERIGRSQVTVNSHYWSVRQFQRSVERGRCARRR
jgi:hypothetical protein